MVVESYDRRQKMRARRQKMLARLFLKRLPKKQIKKSQVYAASKRQQVRLGDQAAHGKHKVQSNSEAHEKKQVESTSNMIYQCLMFLERNGDKETNSFIELTQTIEKVWSDPLFMIQAHGINVSIKRLSERMTEIRSDTNLKNPIPNRYRDHSTSSALHSTATQLTSCARNIKTLIDTMKRKETEIYASAKLYLSKHLFVNEKQNMLLASRDYCNDELGKSHAKVDEVVRKTYTCSGGSIAQQISMHAFRTRNTNGASKAEAHPLPTPFQYADEAMKHRIRYLIVLYRLITEEFKNFNIQRDTNLELFKTNAGVKFLINIADSAQSTLNKVAINRSTPRWMMPYKFVAKFLGNVNNTTFQTAQNSLTNKDKIQGAQASRLLTMVDTVRRRNGKGELSGVHRAKITSLLVHPATDSANWYPNMTRRRIKDILESNELKGLQNRLPSNLATANKEQKMMGKIVMLALEYLLGKSKATLTELLRRTHPDEIVRKDISRRLENHVRTKSQDDQTTPRFRITMYTENKHTMPISADFGIIVKSPRNFSSEVKDMLQYVKTTDKHAENILGTLNTTDKQKLFFNKIRYAQTTPQTFHTNSHSYKIQNVTA